MGSPWTPQPSGLAVNLLTVGPGLGIPSSDLYAEGDGPAPEDAIVRYDGAAWAPSRPSFARCLTCKTQRTAAVGDLLVNAGQAGAVSRWDDARKDWVSEATGLAGDVLALWAAGPALLFAVSDGGGIARWQGGRWEVMASPTSRALRAVFGASAIDVCAVGDLGTIVRFDGSGWSLEDSGSRRALLDVWGSSPLGYFAVGEAGTILHRAPR